MFVAKTAKRNVCTLDFSVDVLQRMRQHMHFICPCCEEQMTLKIGAKRRPHFAHQQKQCTGGFSEGETKLHAEGKALLYAFFKHHQQDVQLEPYIASLQQRPDLLVGAYAIEFQYSALSYERMTARTAGYKKAAYKPIWIPYARHKRAGWQLLTLNELEQRCLQPHFGLAYCITFSPEERAFLYYNYCMQMSATKFYAHVSRIALEEQHFPFYMPRVIRQDLFYHICEVQQNMRTRRLLQRLRFSKEGVQDNVLRMAYERYGSLVNMPPYIGIYVPGAFSFPLPPIDWQLYVVRWYEQYGRTIDDEAHFCAYSGLPPLTATQREAIWCYTSILKNVLMNPTALFSQMYDKIVAIHV